MGRGASFLAGGLIGAVAVFALVPEARERAKDAANAFINSAPAGEGQPTIKEAWDNAVAKGEDLFAKSRDAVSDAAGKAGINAGDVYAKVADAAGDAFAKVQDVATDAAAKVQEVYVKASGKVADGAEEVIPVFADQDDELRAKMEAARQRIAEQIAKNAADAKARAEAAAAAAVTAATDVATEVATAAATVVEQITEDKAE